MESSLMSVTIVFTETVSSCAHTITIGVAFHLRPSNTLRLFSNIGFEWLEKLAKRGEKYDIVIVDPPSTSVGKKKKRWSIKNDADELVALAAPLVKKGGLLWTTTNSASISPIKFARLCRKGLDSVGLQSARLERIEPMPTDFPCIGPQPVKNLVWRIP